MGQTRLELGDCLDVLKTLDDSSVDACVTDPPYGISFMSRAWDYDVPSVAIWQEVYRVLKPGGYLLSFAGTRTQHRMAVAIEDAGFEIRDMIAWVYGSGFPKSLNIGKAVDKMQGNERETISEQPRKGRSAGILGKETEIMHIHDKGTSEWEGWGTALKPALEPITVARKPIEGTVAENCLKWGVGGIDIDGSRVGHNEEAKTTTRKNSPFDIKSGWNQNNLRPPTIASASPQGRFPANLIHDGSEEVVGLFPETTTWAGKRRAKYSETSMFGIGGVNDAPASSGSAARFFYCAKASKSERNMGCEGMEEREAVKQFNEGMEGQLRSDGTVIKESVKHQNNHPTVKPIALMEYLVNMVSRGGQTVLDPFLGSGSTGIACTKLGRDFIGIEREAEYLEIAKARIAAVPQRLL